MFYGLIAGLLFSGNMDGNDITLQNLTVINSFGFDWKSEVTIDCPGDTVTHKKTLRKDGHQMGAFQIVASSVSN